MVRQQSSNHRGGGPSATRGHAGNGAGNRVTSDYRDEEYLGPWLFDIDTDVVWLAASRDVPALKPHIEKRLQQLQKRT